MPVARCVVAGDCDGLVGEPQLLDVLEQIQVVGQRAAAAGELQSVPSGPDDGGADCAGVPIPTEMKPSPFTSMPEPLQS